MEPLKPCPIPVIGCAERASFDKWKFLIPVIGTLGIEYLLAPHIPVGITVGVASFTTSMVMSIASNAFGFFQKTETKSAYKDNIVEYPLKATLIDPVTKEVVFRGLLQPLITGAITTLGIVDLSTAEKTSIIATTALFASAHLYNDQQKPLKQTLLSTISGIAYGTLSKKCGLPASIASHITHNTLAMCLIKFFEPSS